LPSEADIHLLVRLYSNLFACSTSSSDRIGSIGMYFGIPPDHLIELVQIGCDGELRNHESIRAEVRYLLFPIVIEPLNYRDYRNNRGDADYDTEQR
jgi:hypothetical protein